MWASGTAQPSAYYNDYTFAQNAGNYVVKNLEIVVGTPFYGNKWIGTLPGSDANWGQPRTGISACPTAECRRAARRYRRRSGHDSLKAKDITLGTLNFRNTVGTTLAGLNLVFPTPARPP